MGYIRDNDSGFEFEFIKTASCEEYHCHNRIEIIFVKSGSIRLRTDMSHAVFDIFAGDYAVISSSDVHRCFCMGLCEYELIRFPFSYQNMLDSKPVRISFVVPSEVLREQPVVNDTLLHIRKFLSQDFVEKPIARNLCSSLCSILMTFYDKRKKPDFSKVVDEELGQQIEKQNISFETIEKFDLALNYLKENFANTKINLEKLSSVSGLSKTFLSALFPRLTGSNFKDYINHLRVDRAIELITTSEKNISEIAFLCGFDTIRTLNNVFKSIAGATPSEIRSSASGKNKSGIDTEINAEGNKIFDYNWTSSVQFEFDRSENSVYLFAKDKESKHWSHLKLRMLFFAGKEYSISYKAKILDNAVNNWGVNCNFCFPDDVKKIEHHTPGLVSKTNLEDGWQEFSYKYKIPDYYKPSSIDEFSVYTSPYNDKAVNYLVKDIKVLCE